MKRILPLLAPTLLAALAACGGRAEGSVGLSWKQCLDERTADYLTRDVSAWPGLEECFRQS